MPDWKSSMLRTYEYYEVDPGTWKDIRKLTNVKTCTIERDSECDTLGSATIDVTDSLGECYVRVYMITVQNGIKDKTPLGTFLVQTPSSDFDGKIRTVSMDCYTPLLELKENPPPLGYYVEKQANALDVAYRLTKENVRAPVVKATSPIKLFDDFVADTEDTWMTFLSDLLAYAKHSYSIDEMGRILFAPQQDTASLQPVWTYDDGNSSILNADISITHDLYDIPNIVEVVYSNGRDNYYAKVVNDDPNSPTSTVNRGRPIKHRIVDPSIMGDPTEGQIQDYAERVLRELSTVEYTVTYTHGYCPVRVGDCIRLNYSRAGLQGVKAKVISQKIKCTPDCQVTERAVFTSKLWR